ncbi:MAG: DUF5937 family protein [Chloroflexota bacterium]|nr:DUF5937 family protein [Chloroflexota bacterium]
MISNSHVGMLSPEQVAFGYSPIRETLRSLHVVADCRHHPLHIPWVLQARKRMSPALKAEVQRFEFLYGQQTAIFWDIWPHSDFRSFHDELATLRTVEVTAYAEPVLTYLIALAKGGSVAAKILLEPFLSDSAAQELLLARTRVLYPRSISIVQELLSNPQQSQSRFCDFLAAYWEHCMSADWERLERLFLDDITRHGRVLFQGGAFALLEGLSSELVLNRESRTVSLSRSPEANIALDGKSHLFLSPSYFVWPHLSLVIRKAGEGAEAAEKDPGEGAGEHVQEDAFISMLITYSVKELQEEGRAPVPPERVLKMLRAAGDMTRLQILQLIGQRPRSTREIAGLIGISEAAISKHLKILQEAGWLSTQRNSYYVMYRLSHEPLVDLTRGLEQAIGEGASACGIILTTSREGKQRIQKEQKKERL